MPTALLETKFYVPRPRPGLVPRPRLTERLDRGTASRLMLLSAPAGFGKTTLLTEWLAAGTAASTDERLAAWLSLDRADNDPARFWTYLIAALRTVAPGGRRGRAGAPSDDPAASVRDGADHAAQRPGRDLEQPQIGFQPHLRTAQSAPKKPVSGTTRHRMQA